MTAALRTARPEPTPAASPERVSLAARAAVFAISVYQAMRLGRVSPCRFWPSCSNYALEAISRHGAARGLWLTARRLLRCRPLGPSGPDLVPE